MNDAHDGTITRLNSEACKGCVEFSEWDADGVDLFWCEFHSDKGGLSKSRFDRLICPGQCHRIETHRTLTRLREL